MNQSRSPRAVVIGAGMAASPRRRRGTGAAAVEPDPEASAPYEASRVGATRGTIRVTGCRSRYLDDRGVPMAWPWTFTRFREEPAAPRVSEYRFERRG